MLQGYRPIAGGRARSSRKPRECSEQDCRQADRRRSRGGAQPDREHAAGDADRRLRRVPRVACARRARCRPSSPATAWANTRRWSPPGALALRGCAAAGAAARAGDAGSGARGHGRDGGDPRPRRRCGARRRAPRRRRARSSRPVNFNAPGQVVIAGHDAAVERAMRGGEGARRQARGACCR